MSDLLKRVYALMEKAEIKPTQLAKELGMSTSTFSDWAKGKGSPSLKAVMQFSEYARKLLVISRAWFQQCLSHLLRERKDY